MPSHTVEEQEKNEANRNSQNLLGESLGNIDEGLSLGGDIPDTSPDIPGSDPLLTPQDASLDTQLDEEGNLSEEAISQLPPWKRSIFDAIDKLKMSLVDSISPQKVIDEHVKQLREIRGNALDAEGFGTKKSGEPAVSDQQDGGGLLPPSPSRPAQAPAPFLAGVPSAPELGFPAGGLAPQPGQIEQLNV